MLPSCVWLGGVNTGQTPIKIFMRKIFTLLALVLTIGLTSNAQGVYQIPNSDFSQWESPNTEVGNGWYSFSSARLGSGLGLFGSIGKNQSPKPEQAEDRNGVGYSCMIFSKNIVGKKANGNLTTGQINMGNTDPANSENYNLTNRENKHNLLFAGRPDGVEFYAKFTSGGSPHGRGNFILHGDVDYRDPELAEQAEHKIAGAAVLVPATAEWTRFFGEFTYTGNESSTQYMLASFTTNPTPGGSENDKLWIDDVKLVYYHSLTALAYEGATINFDENTLNYDLSDVEYEAGKVSYTHKGIGATVEESFDDASKVLTIAVKGNDFSADNTSVTSYTIRFAGADPEPGPTPEPEPGPGTNEPQPLGTTPVALGDLDETKTYALYNSTFTAYAIYDENRSEVNVWAAEMIGDAGHPLNTTNGYDQEFDVMSTSGAWVIKKHTGGISLFNVGAQKYLTTPGYNDETKPCTFSATEVVLSYETLANNAYAFTATGAELDFMCAAPNNATSPISIWNSTDGGSSWQFFENPNIAPDGSVVTPSPEPEPEPEPEPGPGTDEPQPLGSPIASLADINVTKTYVLYNEAYQAYATFNDEFSSSAVWTAEMIGGDADHPLHSTDYSVELDPTNAGCSWMILQKDGSYYVYNVGAKKYLTTGRPCSFAAEQTSIIVEELGDGKFAFSTTGGAQDFMCASPQMSEGPLAVWETSDAGCQWIIMENPNVEIDREVMPEVTGIESATLNDGKVKGIFTISGVKVDATDPKALPAGLYIIDGKKKVVK